MNEVQNNFINTMVPLIQDYAPQYDIKVCSPIIAQAILESAWGTSKLSAMYYNFFGMKCGSKWLGESVNMITQEEYSGNTVVIQDNFRCYDSVEEGVRGYFEFIQLDRYKNLKGITDPKTYLETIKTDGYATASNYVKDCMDVIETYNLTQYDPEPKTVKVTEKDIIIYGHGSGTPSKKDLQTYTSQRYKNVAPNGKHKGVAAVKRLKALDDNGRVAFEAKYRTILGRNKYSQNLRGYVYKKYSDGNYYSDCSSSGMATFKAIGYNVGSYLLNTAGIYYSDLFETVPVKIRDGHITNPEILKVGDAILYIGSDPSRPLQIGHVEFVAVVPKFVPEKEPSKPTTKKTYSGEYPTLPDRGYFKVGDGYLFNKKKQADVKRVQALVNWINCGKIAVDGKYGSQTKTAVKTAQKAIGVSTDGLFGKQTLAAAKKFKK